MSNAGKSRSHATPDAASGPLPLRAALFQEQDGYGLIVTDGNGTITDWNPAATCMYGYSREEAIGQKTTLIRVPADASRLPDEISAAIARDGRWSSEISFKRKDGTVGISDTVIFAFLDDNGDPATIGINRDISEQKRVQEMERENEARLRLITDNVAANIIYLDSNQRYRFLNKNMADVLGLLPDEVLGKCASEIQGEEMYRQVAPYLEAALGGEEVTFERSRTAANGITRSYQSTYLPHFDENGEVLGVYGLSVDITEPKKAAKQKPELSFELSRAFSDGADTVVDACEVLSAYQGH